MPIYTYKCDTCNDVIDKLVKKIGGDSDSCVCEKCGGVLKKIPSHSGFKINGYSFENGYSGPEHINYDGSSQNW